MDEKIAYGHENKSIYTSVFITEDKIMKQTGRVLKRIFLIKHEQEVWMIHNASLTEIFPWHNECT